MERKNFYEKLCTVNPLYEKVSQSVAQTDVRSLLEDLLSKANTSSNKKISEDLANITDNLERELELLTYEKITFQELKEKQPDKYYEIMHDLLYIKQSKSLKKRMEF